MREAIRSAYLLTPWITGTLPGSRKVYAIPLNVVPTSSAKTSFFSEPLYCVKGGIWTSVTSERGFKWSVLNTTGKLEFIGTDDRRSREYLSAERACDTFGEVRMIRG